MDDIRLIVACNIIRLRTGAGMTQAELGEKLNYSDKTISKWERAESLPDASVLKQIGELFHVSVDDLAQLPRSLGKAQGRQDRRP
jgi:transcriptional regulator with XRE-family HTH domain